LFFADALTGIGYRTSTDAHLTIIAARSGSARRAIVVFPGYVMPGLTLAQAFAPFVADNDVLLVVDYAERGVDVPQICETILEALKAVKPDELRVYGASMGGMLSKLFLDHYRQAGEPYGRVVLVLDSAPASWINIKRPSFLFDVSCWYHGGILSSAIWAGISALTPKAPSDKYATQSIVRAARRGGAWVGMPAVTSQACFIREFAPLRSGELVDTAENVIFLQGEFPDDDPVVRISEAINGWRVAFPNLTVVTVQARKGRWHLPLVEYPRQTVRALASSPRR
jgi:alpha-beta hydrolase superfamily lysophospholipase